ncbi:uncharacterized protein LOC116340109 [Contarinia nasturtii]|uniref:uncharacterized protein LOC116340109 n=1 Tax=Contarinia nasturtii TaxID=265458 RepID=UPI0012D3CFB5|nr:uncharacterized protein LOC116340109 [Contarinia nasturtii]XP_031622204.1 uncharacterized protein LOC116340109 [Contarinia nasturtii]
MSFYRRRGKSAKQKYVENRRLFNRLLHEHYENDEEIPPKKPKLTPKPRAVRTPKPKDAESQTPKAKRSKKVLTPKIEGKTPKVKRSKKVLTPNIEEQTPKANFMDMNNDCIREIMVYLDENDLCSLSTQCQRLRNLTKCELFRRFPNEPAKIERFEENGYWFRYPGVDKFIVCFAQFNKLSIGNAVSNVQSIENLYEYLQAKEHSRIDEIHFEGCRNIRPTHGRAMAKMVEQTKSVTFNRLKITGEFYKSMLCHFPSMENLVLRNSFDMVCEEGAHSNWLKEIYPNLKNFSWFVDEEIEVTDELKLFFEQNKTIKHFSLYTRRIETLKQLEAADIKITHLYFRITHNVEQKLLYFQTMCDNYQSLQLHLMFEDRCRSELTSHIKLFSTLKTNLRGLYLDGLPPSVKLAELIAGCVDLRDLQVRHCKVIDQFADLPMLENVYVSRGMVEGTQESIYNMIYQFATQAPNLKNLFFRNSCRLFESFNFRAINNKRSQLEGATEMTFHVRTKSKDRINELSNMQVHYDMLNIKITDRESLPNPLTTDWLYTH